jgi:tetratricopeptide (TPR) repeat protein
MKAPVLLCLAFCLATAHAEKPPAENSDESDDAKASAALLAGDYDAAISLYTEVIQASPKAALAYNGRALAYRYKKEITKALADFDQAIRLKPFSMFFYNRGVTRYENGDDKSAIADLTRALQDKPRDPRVRALCLVARARWSPLPFLAAFIFQDHSSEMPGPIERSGCLFRDRSPPDSAQGDKSRGMVGTDRGTSLVRLSL